MDIRGKREGQPFQAVLRDFEVVGQDDLVPDHDPVLLWDLGKPGSRDGHVFARSGHGRGDAQKDRDGFGVGEFDSCAGGGKDDCKEGNVDSWYHRDKTCSAGFPRGV